MTGALKTAVTEALHRSGGVSALRALRVSALRRPRLLVLAWHRVDDRSRLRGSVPVAAFREQAGFCARRFDVRTLAEAAAYARGERALTRDTVALTFDDGWLEHHRVVAPILERLGLPATFFVCSRSRTHAWEPQAPLMGPDEILDLARRGFAIGGHTRTHPKLAGLSDEACRDEVRGHLDDLRALGLEVSSFAYPFGDAGTIGEVAPRLLAEAGVAVAVTTEERAVSRGDAPLRLPRKVVTGQPLGRIATRLERLAWAI